MGIFFFTINMILNAEDPSLIMSELFDVDGDLNVEKGT